MMPRFCVGSKFESLKPFSLQYIVKKHDEEDCNQFF